MRKALFVLAIAGLVMPAAAAEYKANLSGNPADPFGFSQADGPILWDNGPFDGVNGLASERNTIVPEASVADDFTVGDLPWLVTGVRALHINVPGLNLAAADVAIYGVDSIFGGPDKGNVIFAGNDLPVTEIDTGQRPFGFDLNELVVKNLNVNLAAGTTYFLSVRGVGNGPNEGNRSFWATTGNGVVQKDMGYFQSDYFGFPNWTPVTSVLGVPTDFSFQLQGEKIPEPATMSLLALGGLALLRRRR